MVIGVLALQGSVEEHCSAIESMGDRSILVRTPEDLENIEGLILPGGESSTLSLLLRIKVLDVAIDKKITEGLPVWGTCAGLILLSKNWLDIDVNRNGFGRQLSSFSSKISFRGSLTEVRFIRAPRITRVGDSLEVLALWENEVIAVKHDNILGTTFHPEVTNDSTIYNYFRTMIAN